MGGEKERPVTCAEFKRILKDLGFSEERVRHGSHEKWTHPDFKGRQQNIEMLTKLPI